MTAATSYIDDLGDSASSGLGVRGAMLMGVTLTVGMEGVGASVMGMLGTGVTGAVARLSGGVAIGVLGVEGCDGGVSMGDAVI